MRSVEQAAYDCLSGGGDMGALMRATDWSQTPFGPVETWPQSLRTAVSIMLESRFAMVVAWGPEFRFFYNDRYRPVLGAKHPALGKACAEIFPEVWPIIGPEFERVRRGEAFAIDDWYLPLERHGYPENCWFTLSYSPIRDETGGVGGLLAVVAETTGRVDSERRLATLRDLAQSAATVTSDIDACTNAATILERNQIDVPFALFYLTDADGGVARLVSAMGIPLTHPAAAPALIIGAGDQAWPCNTALTLGRQEIAGALEARCEPPLSGGPYPEPAHTAVVLPLSRPGADRPYGIVVAGVSPRRALDEAYLTFLTLAAEHIATAIANTRAFEEERRRAERLADLDRAKTAFFSNVSHEFRTPLTLMLGPVEELLADGDLSAAHHDALTLTHRNALRLRKLVNTLLDFSRIEAGRIEAVYEPVDLAEYTTELASAFRAAIDKAGVRFVLDCEPIGDPVYLDREMWEKIVLNLISNAFKFTFEGEIRVAIRRAGDHAALEVRDTGSGIPADQLPHVFERFHRVEATKGRTHEGTGIGLALVNELVKLHGGTIQVESVLGAGTAFTISVPLGHSHLPEAQVARARSLPSTGVGADAFVEEALRWLPEEQASPVAEVAHDDRTTILVADDNADMRGYIKHLLGGRWRVEVVSNGSEALNFLRSHHADLVIADVMMPTLDGFGLLREIRADALTRDTRVLMLSARAGEESKIEGLRAGANDYLVKPFSARELVARVEAQLLRAEVEAIEEAHNRRLATIFTHAPVAIALLKGPQHVVQFANEAYAELVAHRPMIGRTARDAFPEFEQQGVYELLDTVYATGTPFLADSMRVRLHRGPAGAAEDAVLKFIYQPIPNAAGGVEGIAVIATDVTDLANARRAAEAANRAKDEFLAMLGHELRNPLAPILTALQLMSLRDGAGTLGKERAVIDRQVRHLMRLVDDLLDVSRIARGKVELALEHVELAEIVARAIEMASPLLEERRHNLSVRVPRRGMVVHGDAARLSQVVQNLLTNAAKYTEPNGRIEIEAIRHGAMHELQIRDNGIGIAAEMLPTVFELFVQSGQAIDRSQGGLGLGLTIVRKMVELHGGSVEARSEGANRGSTFTVRLPAAQVPAPVKAAHRRPSKPKVRERAIRVLVVDDNRDALSMLAEALRTFGYDVRTAGDGPSALAKAEQFQPQVALLDLGLPVMDGYEVAERLRSLDTPPLTIAVTGYGQDADRTRSESAGFAAHFVKPVDLEELRNTLERMFTHASSSAPA
jgi:signal transduction histidine kinase/DNA-binding response OmpR family regulator